jgi:hypothetical protein
MYPNFNGEMAQFYAERDWEADVEAEPEDRWPIYLDLMEEAARRGLNTSGSGVTVRHEVA